MRMVRPHHAYRNVLGTAFFTPYLLPEKIWVLLFVYHVCVVRTDDVASRAGNADRSIVYDIIS
jgi:hypothetical protein